MSSPIVGRKVTTYLTAVKHHPQAHWIVTKHTIINELHATKGWRQIMHHRETQTRRALPSVKEWRLHDVTTFERTKPRRRPRNYYDGMFVTLAALERHGWHRRKMDKEAAIAAGHYSEAAQ